MDVYSLIIIIYLWMNGRSGKENHHLEIGIAFYRLYLIIDKGTSETFRRRKEWCNDYV